MDKLIENMIHRLNTCWDFIYLTETEPELPGL